MSQLDIADVTGATYIGVESTYGTTPAMTRMFPAGPSQFAPTQDNIENTDERTRLFNAPAKIQGLQNGSGTVKYSVRPDSTQLTHAASTVVHPLGELLRCFTGGVEAHPGSTIQAASTSTNVIAAAADTADIAVGYWMAAEVSGTLEPFLTKTIGGASSNELTPWPSLSGAPNVGGTGLLIGSYTYYLTQAAPPSFTIQHAKAGNSANAATSAQWTLNGCFVDTLDLTFPRGQLISCSAKVNVGQWTGPSSQSIAVTAATDAMSKPVAMVGATILIQTPATLTKSHVVAKSISVKLNPKQAFVEDVGGTTQGKAGVVRTGVRPAATVTIRQRFDSTMEALYGTQTAQSICVIVPIGTLLTKQFVILDIGNAVMNAKPQLVVDGGGMDYFDYTFDCLEDTRCATSGLTGANLDRAVSPVRLVLIS